MRTQQYRRHWWWQLLFFILCITHCACYRVYVALSLLVKYHPLMIESDALILCFVSHSRVIVIWQSLRRVIWLLICVRRIEQLCGDGCLAWLCTRFSARRLTVHLAGTMVGVLCCSCAFPKAFFGPSMRIYHCSYLLCSCWMSPYVRVSYGCCVMSLA